MKKFMDKDFLLKTETAKTLYHDYAAKMPIIDYHCHINPKEIWEDRRFDTITDAWLEADHYKWRSIRSNGINEKYITGDGDKLEKFGAFAGVMDKCIGNPLYHWAHLELQRYFDFQGNLSSQNAKEVFEICNQKLKSDKLSVRGLIKQSNVMLICSTDDPLDSLEYHQKIAADDSFETKVLPAWRPDKLMAIEAEGFCEYIAKLSEVSGIEIEDAASLKTAILNRLDYFDENGCKASDHSLGHCFFAPHSDHMADEIFRKAMEGLKISEEASESFKTAMLCFLGKEYARRGWVMQLHIGPVRNSSERMYKKLGPDAGYDCMGPMIDSRKLISYLNELDKNDLLPKTIIYSLNPGDNAAIGTVIGAFQNDQARGKVQHGSAWWFNDSIIGMDEHLRRLASLSLLGNFIGMLTDSRSFLSYTRHEYFRRILCNVIGEWVENGEYPCNIPLLGKTVQDISYNNAKEYFAFDI